VADPDLTPNLKLERVPANSLAWTDRMNTNMTLIDATVGAYFALQNLQGPWENSHAYGVGETVIDVESATVWQCQVAHISSMLPTTFAEDRVGYSTYWTVYSSPARARGAWTGPGTSYSINDFVVNGSQYAVCISSHTSSITFADDVSLSRWSILVDLSLVGSQVLPVLSGILDANKFVITNSAGTGYDIYDQTGAFNTLGATSLGIALLQAVSAAAARTTINAQIAGSYQNSSAFLTAISGLTSTANSFLYFDASNAAAIGVITPFGRNLVDDTNASTARTTLGLGTAAVANTGTSAGNVVVLDGSAKLPAVDGSQLTNLPVGSSGWEIGDVKLRYGTTAGAGWLLMNDGTIGNASSGATYANAAYLSLYIYLYSVISDTWAPVSGGRTGNATNDFNSGKTLTLSKMLGRTLAVAGAGSGLTSRAIGENLGTETVAAEMPAHTHSTTRVIGTVEVAESIGGTYLVAYSPTGYDNGGTTGSASSGDGNMNVMQPSTFLNAFIRYTT